MSQDEGNFEVLLQQIQSTFTQLWLRMTGPEAAPPQGEVVILGKRYNSDINSAEIASAINSRIWCTYRSGFEPISRDENGPAPLMFLRSMLFSGSPNATAQGLMNPGAFSTDVGWGCMIRTSQLLLANTFQSLLLGDYTYKEDSEPEVALVEILLLFGDTYECPFSLHNFIRAASELPLQVKPGEWFGPSAASLSIKRLCIKANAALNVPRLLVHISESCDMYDDEMHAQFEHKLPVLVLFPIRLGIDRVNAIYHPSLFQLLALKQSVGIAGGKPSSSYYFFGSVGENLLYLDPHNLQPVSPNAGTYHTSRCQTLPISALDPSMLVGVLLHNEADYADFKEQMKEGANKIVHFHERSKRRNSTTGEDYVKVSSSQVEDTDDFVDIGDEISDEVLAHEAEASMSDSFSKYDIVERPDN